mgnify:CR=1 FL=1
MKPAVWNGRAGLRRQMERRDHVPRAERIVEVIPATWNPADESVREIRKLRVAAYCRVSTELEQQQSSYDIQIEYYTRHIMQNPTGYS